MGYALYDINKGGHCIFILHVLFQMYTYHFIYTCIVSVISNSLMTFHGTVFLTLNLVTEANDI